MSPDDLEQLVVSARAGDHGAWEQLYCRIYPRLRGYAVRRVPSEAVDDVVSETMTRAVESIGRFRWAARDFDPWLFGIARHVCADHHRRAGRGERIERAARGLVTVDGDPGERMELVEEHSGVRVAFERLDPQDREILELRVIAGLSAEQVGKVLGKRAGAIRTAQSRALARLRTNLDER